MNFINTINVKFNKNNKFAMTEQELKEMYDVIVSAGDVGVHKKTLSRIMQKKIKRWPDIERNLVRLEACGGLLAEEDEVLYSLEAFPYPTYFDSMEVPLSLERDNQLQDQGKSPCSPVSQIPAYS